MTTKMISTAPSFQTSVNIAYDLNNSEKIRGLIPTNEAVSLFKNFLHSTDSTSTNRAKILIGAYGKGKSHMVLSILSFLCSKNTEDSEKLLRKVKEVDSDLYGHALNYLDSDKKLLPVVINGSSLSLVQSFMSALQNTLKQYELTGIMPSTHFSAAINMIRRWDAEFPDTMARFQEAINMPVADFIFKLENFDVETYALFERIYPSLTAGSEFNPFAGFNVIELYESVIEKLPEKGYSGIIVVYDEFSKYLESSISKASISDIKMLQDFAEKCVRTGKNQLHLLLISHKDIENYIDVLPKQKVDGWKGVSERFSHVNMQSDFTQTYELVSKAIVKEPALWDSFYKKHFKRFENMKQQFKGELLFAECDEKAFDVAVVGCYPLHPLTTFILPRISEKVAQNERTLFTFISGQEQNTLSAVLERLNGDFPIVKPDALYDYFAPQMRKEVYTSEIHQLYRLTSSILSKLEPGSLHERIIKTISLIYCLGQFERLAPTVDTIINIYADEDISAKEINDVIMDLVQKQCVVYLKRSNAFLKLKESSGVDIYTSITDTIQKRSSKSTEAELLNAVNLEPYAYPIRYNDQHEITRYFQFSFITGEEFLNCDDLSVKVNSSAADGMILGILPDGEDQLSEIQNVISERTKNICRAVFVLPEQARGILKDLKELDAVKVLRDAAYGDELLMDEYDMIYQDLSELVHRHIAQYTRPENHGARYYYKGEAQQLYRKAHLTNLLSNICDDVYSQTPTINNEVINKNHLSTVAFNSRSRLLNGLLSTPLQFNLGLAGSGQDVSFMRSTLIVPGILKQTENQVEIVLTPEDDKLAAVLKVIDDFIIATQTSGEASFGDLYNTLMNPDHGIGLRKGVIPIYVAAVLQQYQSRIVIRNLYNEVMLSASLLTQINDKPEDFYVKIEEWTNAKDTYISAIELLFADYIRDAERESGGYNYLAVALGRWYLSLPKYAKELKNVYSGISASAQPVAVDAEKRKFLALLKQPSIGTLDLLFNRIPRCYGMDDVTNELVEKIAATKAFFDSAKKQLEDTLIRDVKAVLCTNSPEEATVTSAVLDWHEELSYMTKTKLYPNGAERLFSIIKNSASNEYDFVENLAKGLTGLRVDDWSENTIAVFCKKIIEYKETIELEEAKADDIGKESVLSNQTEYSVVFIDESGAATQRSFERVERGPKTKMLYNRIENALKESGQSISPAEKRQVLMEILEKLC